MVANVPNVTDGERHARFLGLLDDVDGARRQLEAALRELATTIESTRAGVREGTRVSTVHPNVRLGPVRREVSKALAALNSALMHARAEGIRVMVDDEGLSLRDAAKLVGSSRQFVSRLYHHARDAFEGEAG